MALWHKTLSSGPPPVQAGDNSEWLLHLDRCYRRPLARYFEKRIRETYDVEDLVQEVFLRLAQRESFQDIDSLEGFVFRIAANVLNDRVRRQAVRKAGQHQSLEDCELPTNDFSPERVLEGRQQLERAIVALRELPERTQHVFALRVYEDLKQEEIAARFKMSVEGVRFHLRRAKAHLARSVEQE